MASTPVSTPAGVTTFEGGMAAVVAGAGFAA